MWMSLAVDSGGFMRERPLQQGHNECRIVAVHTASRTSSGKVRPKHWGASSSPSPPMSLRMRSVPAVMLPHWSLPPTCKQEHVYKAKQNPKTALLLGKPHAVLTACPYATRVKQACRTNNQCGHQHRPSERYAPGMFDTSRCHMQTPQKPCLRFQHPSQLHRPAA